MDNKILSEKGFENWFSSQDDSKFFIGQRPEDPNQKYIGRMTHTKVSEKKLLEKIETRKDKNALVCEFVEHGGKIIDIDPRRIQIETKSGKFYLPRFCVKIEK